MGTGPVVELLELNLDWLEAHACSAQAKPVSVRRMSHSSFSPPHGLLAPPGCESANLRIPEQRAF
jgi:hypothetical protein